MSTPFNFTAFFLQGRRKRPTIKDAAYANTHPEEKVQ
jgi:hypothetical protein